MKQLTARRDMRLRLPAAGQRHQARLGGQAGAGASKVKIAENGEVLVRSAAMLKEYHRRPDATAESSDSEGYFHRATTAGLFDSDGH